jgi:hypothetical protein
MQRANVERFDTASTSPHRSPSLAASPPEEERRKFTRPFNASIILRLSSPLIVPHRAISSSERPQPWQRPLAWSRTQTLMQGVSITDRWGVC